MHLWPGLCPGPHWESLQRSPDPLAAGREGGSLPLPKTHRCSRPFSFRPLDSKKLCIPGILKDIITIIQNLYEGRQSSVKWRGLVVDWFTVITGVRQGFLSPLLFALVIDWIMRKALTSLDVGLQWTNGMQLCDLDYADDNVLLDSSTERMQKLTKGVEDE